MSQQWGGGAGSPSGGYGAYGGYGGSGGYGAYPPGGGYGPPGGHGGPPPGSARNAAVVALIINIVAVLFCCGIVSIGGLICAAMAMSKADTEPEAARSLNMWAWILLGVTFLIDVVIVIVLIAAPSLLLAIFGGLAGTSGDY